MQIAESRAYRVLAGDAAMVLARVAHTRHDRTAAGVYHRSAGASYAGSGLPEKQRSLDRFRAMLADRSPVSPRPPAG